MKIIFILILFLVSFGCSKNEQKISVIKEQSQELEMITAYNNAYQAFTYFIADSESHMDAVNEGTAEMINNYELDMALGDLKPGWEDPTVTK